MTKTIAELLQDLDDDTDTLGQLMASNLTSQGVTASASDGLTTLAGKILLVPSGGGTSTVATLELITNKTIVSYSDSETATLTITAKDSNNNPVTNETIYIYKNNIAIGTVTTNNNGIAEYTYNSTGIGDITLTTATNSTLSNSITIEDCVKYDDATTNKTSNYSTWNCTQSWSDNVYSLTKSLQGSASNSNYFGYVFDEDIVFPSEFEISIDIKVTNQTYHNEGIGFYNTRSNGAVTSIKRLQNCAFLNTHGLYIQSNGTEVYNGTNNGRLSNNTWYTYYLKYQDGVLTAKILNGSTEVYSQTHNFNDLASYPYFNIGFANFDSAEPTYWKNLKIKKL